MSNKKKVLFLASSAPRFKGDGTAPFILNMAKDISDLGFQVDVLVPHTAGIKNWDAMNKGMSKYFALRPLRFALTPPL